MPHQICLVSPTFPPDFGWDPISRNSLELAQGLKDRGHDVSVFSLSSISSGECVQDEMPTLRIDSMTNSNRDGKLNLIQETTPMSRLTLSVSVQFWREFFKLNVKNNFEVIIAPDHLPYALFPTLASRVSFLMLKNSIAPAILAEQMQATGTSTFALDKRFSDYLNELNCELADAFVSEAKISEALDSRDPRPVHVIPFCLDTDQFCDRGKRAIDTKGRKAIALLGSASTENEKEFLKELLSKLKPVQNNSEIHITLILDNLAFEDREKDVQKKLSAESIEVDSLINSNLCRNLMPDIWRSHQVVCMLPSGRHSDYSFLEPMACGVAVVSPDNVLSQAYLKSGRIGILCKQASAEIYADNVRNLLKDESIRKKLTDAARARVLDRFSRDAAACKYELAIKDAIEYRQSPQAAHQRACTIAKMFDKFTDLADSYKIMLYDFLFVRSWRFKFKHWAGRIAGQNTWKH